MTLCCSAVVVSCCCAHCTLLAGKHGNFGKVHIQGEEVADNKFDIFLQLAASNLDKKDFFGKVCVMNSTLTAVCVPFQIGSRKSDLWM